MDTQEHIKIAHIQEEIQQYIGLPKGQIIFEYNEFDREVKLDLITVNPMHRQSFLFHSCLGANKLEVFNALLDYVKNYKDKESSYTIQWTLKEKSDLHTSYFSAKNIHQALDKLYYGREPNSIIVFSVVLNPIS